MIQIAKFIGILAVLAIAEPAVTGTDYLTTVVAWIVGGPLVGAMYVGNWIFG